MKVITNKKTSILSSLEGEVKPMSYVDLLKMIMNFPPSNGYSISEMRQRLKIYSQLESSKDNTISLEDADFEVVKACVIEFRWTQAHKEIVEFVDHIESL